MVSVGVVLLACCASVHLALAGVILWRSRRRVAWVMAAFCVVTGGWAVAGLLGAISGIGGAADLVRALAAFGLLFVLYRDAQFGKPWHEVGFVAGALGAAALGVAALGATAVGAEPGLTPTILPLGITARLILAVVELLLIENLYMNLPEHERWHVALPSVLLGGVACFDILLCADLVLFHQASASLWEARTIGMIMVSPLLAVAATRGRRWGGRVRLSRTAAFHSATLVLSGSVLLALGLAGEVFRHLEGDWGWLAEVSLAFAAAMGLGLLLTSGSGRSRIQRLVIDHFFAERYDYRRQWQACIRTLSGEADDADDKVGPEGLAGGLSNRVIRTMASVVDSPAGALFLRDGAAGPFQWAGSWNMAATAAVPEQHPLITAMQSGAWVARLDGAHQAALSGAPLDGLPPLWLAVPLLHRGALTGFVLTGLPRAPFELEQEVFDLLRIVAQEVATYIAEQRATQRLLQAEQLHDYSKRFAFVAHDIKNVSSQLALLVSNAESHIGNPEFQKDMVETVRSSVRKVTALLQRLEAPEAAAAPAALSPAARLQNLVATYRRVRRVPVLFEQDGSVGSVAMGADAFETAVTHLLNNAVEAGAGLGRPVIVRVRHEARQVVVEIIDQGAGMTAEFVRDELFRPFGTQKVGGTGIGAFQARELLREAGGELVVESEPGAGTTMRALLPRTDALPSPASLVSPLPDSLVPARVLSSAGA